MPKQRRPLINVSFRIPAAHVQKIGWLSSEKGITPAEFVRTLVADAVRNAKPPVDAKSREILASDEEWGAWEKMAAQKQTTPGELVRRLLTRLVEKQAS
jgi:hypothetical protein